MTTTIFPYSEAKIRLSDLLRLASKEGEVRLTNEDGQVFIIRPALNEPSPFDIKSANLGLTVQEIDDFVRESREQSM